MYSSPSNASASGNASQSTRQNAAQYAGYAQFYQTADSDASSTGYPQSSVQQQPYYQPRAQQPTTFRVPPPPSAILRPPPPPQAAVARGFPPNNTNGIGPNVSNYGYGPQPVASGRPPPPRAVLMRGPPPPRPAAINPNNNGWQWSTGKDQAATGNQKPVGAQPVRFQFAQHPHLARPVARSTSKPTPAFTTTSGVAAPLISPTAPPMAKTTTANDNAGASGNNTKWPDSLHDYVKRAFARCKGAADQSLTQSALKQRITDAIMQNQLWTKNWAAEPLPTLVGDVPHAKPNVVNAFATPSALASAPRGPVPGAPPRGPPVLAMQQPSQPHRMNFTVSSQSKSPAKLQTTPISINPSTEETFIPLSCVKKKNKRKAAPGDVNNLTTEDLRRKTQRRQRFLKDQFEAARNMIPSSPSDALSNARVLTVEGDLDLDAMTIKGTCQKVEKEYLRLTSAPQPSTVRPETILKRALALVKQKWKQGDCDYEYACSQMKSIRQDCTVQRIKNAFTVQVYETHARIALESGDINEFNQCQTQLHELYEKDLPGQAIEFLSYRILYSVYVCLQAKNDSKAGTLGMYHVLSRVTAELRRNECIRHALQVREAVTMNDYHRFFKLHKQSPNMSGYLMDSMLAAIRLRALRAICKAYRPHVPIDYVRQELHLTAEEDENFVNECGIKYVGGTRGDRKLVDTKTSEIVWVLSSQSSLI